MLEVKRIAEGQAHVDPRLAPTMEQDTAAAQAVLEAAGGLVVKAKDGEATVTRSSTNKEDLTDPRFVAAASIAPFRLGGPRGSGVWTVPLGQVRARSPGPVRRPRPP